MVHTCRVGIQRYTVDRTKKAKEVDSGEKFTVIVNVNEWIVGKMVVDSQYGF